MAHQDSLSGFFILIYICLHAYMTVSTSLDLISSLEIFQNLIKLYMKKLQMTFGRVLNTDVCRYVCILLSNQLLVENMLNGEEWVLRRIKRNAGFCDAVMVTKVSVVFRFCSLLHNPLPYCCVAHHVENPKSFVNFQKITMLWWCNILLTYCPAGISPFSDAQQQCSQLSNRTTKPSHFKSLLTLQPTIQNIMMMMIPYLCIYFKVHLKTFSVEQQNIMQDNMTRRYL